MKLPRKLLVFPPIMLGVVILILVLSFKSGPQQKEMAEHRTPAAVIQLKQLDFKPRATGYGPVQPGRVWRAIAQVGGTVIAINPKLEPGVLLPADSLVARIDPTEYQLAVSQATSQLHNAESQLDQLDLEARNLQRTLELEKENLGLAEAELKRNIRLMESNNVSETVLERFERDVVGQRLRVQSIENNLGMVPVRREQLNSQKELAESRLADSRRRLAFTEIRTPYDCRIEARNVLQGEAVAPGTVLVVADSIDRAEIEARFSIEQLAPLLPDGIEPIQEFGLETGQIFEHLGLKALVRLKAGRIQPEWEAKVSRSSASLDPKTRTSGIIVTVEEPYRQVVTGVKPPLVKGMFCEVELSGPNRQMLLIPRDAIHGDLVYLVNSQDRLELVKVKIAGQQGNLAWVEAGLKQGDWLVVTDLVPAVEGMLLEPRPDSELEARMAAEAAGGGRL